MPFEKEQQKWVAYALGVSFIVIMLGVAIAFPNPYPFQYVVFRVILALAAAGVAAMIPGFINFEINGIVRTGGAIAVFFIVYYVSPAQLVAQLPSQISENKEVKANNLEEAVIFTNTPPIIDGKLDDTTWSHAKTIVFASHPSESGSTTATVKLLWDKQYLYAGFDVGDTQVEGSSIETPWDSDSVSLIIYNGGTIQEYRHSLLNDIAGKRESEYQLKPGTTFNKPDDSDKGYTIEMRIRWDSVPSAGDLVAADFLSVDHDQNPGGLHTDVNTIFSKLSWDGDQRVDTAGGRIRLSAK